MTGETPVAPHSGADRGASLGRTAEGGCPHVSIAAPDMLKQNLQRD